jgi:hypothetical protein
MNGFDNGTLNCFSDLIREILIDCWVGSNLKIWSEMVLRRSFKSKLFCFFFLQEIAETLYIYCNTVKPIQGGKYVLRMCLENVLGVSALKSPGNLIKTLSSSWEFHSNLNCSIRSFYKMNG